MEWIKEILIENGLAGAVIAGLAVTVVYLYKENCRLTGVILEITKEYSNDHKKLTMQCHDSIQESNRNLDRLINKM